MATRYKIITDNQDQVITNKIITLKAGTTAASTSPLKFAAGTLNTTPELGAVEFTDNGTDGKLYITLNVGGVLTREEIAFSAVSSIVDAGGTLSLEYGNDYFFSGTTATWTLPAINANIAGRDNSITIKNRGTGNLTVNTNGGLNTMFTTALTNTTTLSVGDAVILMPDGTYLNIE